MKRIVGAVLLALVLQACAPASRAQDLNTEAGAKAFLKGLKPEQGVVHLDAAKAQLDLGKDLYFLDAEDARKVMTQVWQSPSEMTDEVIGMVFPADATPLDAPWAAVVSYFDVGYVSDADAKQIDSDKILQELRTNDERDNVVRRRDGAPEVHTIGWAEPPTYDPDHRAMLLAAELSGSDQARAVNYDLRILCRSGMLGVNVTAGDDERQSVGPALKLLQRAVTFDPGARYADYKPGEDKLAPRSVANLVRPDHSPP